MLTTPYCREAPALGLASSAEAEAEVAVRKRRVDWISSAARRRARLGAVKPYVRSNKERKGDGSRAQREISSPRPCPTFRFIVPECE